LKDKNVVQIRMVLQKGGGGLAYHEVQFRPGERLPQVACQGGCYYHIAEAPQLDKENSAGG
jgi:hypothetical protein